MLLGLALSYTYLAKPVRWGTERSSVPWYDVALAVVAIGICTSVAVSYSGVTQHFKVEANSWNWPAAILIILLLEGTRRVLGWPFVFVLAAFFLYALFGDQLPGRLQAVSDPIRSTYAAYLVFEKRALLAGWPALASVVWVALLGQMIAFGGGRRWFADLVSQYLSASPRRSASPVILYAAAIGSVSKDGIYVPISMGPTTIPTLGDQGWDKVRVAGLHAAAGAGSYVLPISLGAAALTSTVFTEIPISQIIAAALIPGILFFFSLYLTLPRSSPTQPLTSQPKQTYRTLLRHVMRGWHLAIAIILAPIVFFWCVHIVAWRARRPSGLIRLRVRIMLEKRIRR